MLEDTSLSISALRRVIQEILTDRSQVLSAQSLLLLELVLAVCKPTALIFLTILAGLSVQPESAQLCLDLLFPTVLHLDDNRLAFCVDDGNVGSLSLRVRGVKASHFLFLRNIVAGTTIRLIVGASSHRRGLVHEGLLSLLKRE